VNILVVGSGGREDALTWKIAQSPRVAKLYCTPGNPGMARHAECVNIGVNDFDALAAFAKENAVDLVVVGPEDPLAGGIVDRLAAEGIKAFGPCAAAAQLEASKAFAKNVMAKYGIPTAAYGEFDDADAAITYIKEKGAPIVIKADGLAAGKGVTVAQNVDQAIAAVQEAMVSRSFGEAGAKIIVEECLFGEEASILAFTDGATIIPMVASQDHKPAFDDDQGPNTGGMGAYSPAPVVTDTLSKEIFDRELQPCVEGLRQEGITYKGVLYAGLMITSDGPKVVEFNCRFGDPETQVVLPRLKSDLVDVMEACCDGTLGSMTLEWDEQACVSVVMASGGYPRAYAKGLAITGIPEAEREAGVVVFHAGTTLDNNTLVTGGGRVLNVTAVGPDIASTIAKAYKGVKQISFDKAHYRTDIGKKALARLQ